MGADINSNSSYAPVTRRRARRVADRICSVSSPIARSAPRARVRVSFNKARSRAKLVQRDKDVAQAEYREEAPRGRPLTTYRVV